MAILLDDKVFFVVFGLFGDRDDLSPTRTLFGFRVCPDDRFDLFADNAPAPRIVGVPSALFEQSLNLACTFLFRFELFAIIYSTYYALNPVLNDEIINQKHAEP